MSHFRASRKAGLHPFRRSLPGELCPDTDAPHRNLEGGEGHRRQVLRRRHDSLLGRPSNGAKARFNACRAARLGQERLLELNRRWGSEGKIPLTTRWGSAEAIGKRDNTDTAVIMLNGVIQDGP